VEALNAALDGLDYHLISNPKHPIGLVNQPESIRKLFRDEHYFKPLVQVSKKLIQAVKNLENGEKPQALGNLYSELYQSFFLNGFTPEIARAAVWDVLALYGSRGTALDYIFPMVYVEVGFNEEVLWALQNIYSATTYLDGLIGDGESGTGGINFTIPENYKGICHNGKPYHFWMAAIIGHEVLKKGFDKVAAFHIPYMISIAHELGARSPGRNPDLIFNQPSDSAYTLAVRANLAMRAMGALFAIDEHDKGPKRNIDYDVAIYQMSHDVPAVRFWTPSSELNVHMQGSDAA
jgi:hypothetical protein